ncbi:MAG TPA: M20/M25/M40 family metallo-hydrolase [Gemmatimonadaceae bacterium]|nr:M20/M25/M40 family metallo-hydrolase [Gemmatimonadaceae bacterium]
MRFRVTLALLVFGAGSIEAQPRMASADSAMSRAILTELIGIQSISSTRATVDAANAIVRRLRAAGFSEQDAFVTGSSDSVGNVVARLRGHGTVKPILLMAHLDVVPALREDWTTDPFVMTEKDGWWYGRGTIDNKEGVATIVANLIRWKRSGFVPHADIVAVMTGDEETTSEQIEWFSSGAGRRHIGDPRIALNFDAGRGTIYGGREAELGVQVSEKVYVTYRMTVRNAGGHSSQPRADNAIYSLSRALGRLAEHRFPIEVSATTRLALERSAAFETDSIARLMRLVARQPMNSAAARRLTRITRFNAQLRTTCVATRLTGGHADNALPQMAQATVNCRMLPGTDTAMVVRALRAAVADTAVEVVEAQPATVSPPSPLPPDLLSSIETVAKRFWPGVVVVPVMSSGATDGSYVRNAGIPVYGVAGMFSTPDEARAHGRDERIEARRYYEGIEFARALIERLTTTTSRSK